MTDSSEPATARELQRDGFPQAGRGKHAHRTGRLDINQQMARRNLTLVSGAGSAGK